LAVSGLAIVSCSGNDRLTKKEREKISPKLRPVVVDGERGSNLQTTTRGDGAVAYHLLVRTDDPEALRKADLSIGSVSGKVVTARWTVEEIRRAAQLEEVRLIEPAGEAGTTG
jgi:hypothetical protein